MRRVLKKEMENKWVALSADYKKVFDFSDDLVLLTKKIGTEKVVYMKVPCSTGSCSRKIV